MNNIGGKAMEHCSVVRLLSPFSHPRKKKKYKEGEQTKTNKFLCIDCRFIRLSVIFSFRVIEEFISRGISENLLFLWKNNNSMAVSRFYIRHWQSFISDVLHLDLPDELFH